MDSQQEPDRDHRSQAPRDLESPFVQEELFAAETETQWEAPLLSALEAESPFLNALQQDWTRLTQQEEPESLEEPEEEREDEEETEEPSHPEEPEEQFVEEESSHPSLRPMTLSQACIQTLKKTTVAVVGAGLGGLMAARRLGQHGIKVTVYEARPQVGGRVLSNHTFSSGRIVEEGAELIGSFHTMWLRLAREYGIGVISRMDEALYEREGLGLKLWLDKDLSQKEIKALLREMDRVLRRIAVDASQITDEERPWDNPTLKATDQTSVADALEKRYGVKPGSRLWMGLEFLLVNDEVAQFKDMNYLGLLCKVKGGQGERLAEIDPEAGDDPLMGYWEELEIFRCADGCQKMADRLAAQIKTGLGGKVLLGRAVTHINITEKGVVIGSRKVVDSSRGTLDDDPAILLPYDYVVLAIPPSVWEKVAVSDSGKKLDLHTEVGRLGMGGAIKLFSDVKERFWIREGLAPSGGSSSIGQVWEGTDNQTRTGKQGIVLSVFAGPIINSPKGPRPPTADEIQSGLRRLYPSYTNNLTKKPLYRNWPEVPFIKTGYASPRPGQIFTIGKKLNEPFHRRMFFAGEHTHMAFFGYMEGALRSGKNAADLLLMQACGLLKAQERPRVRLARGELEDREDTAFEPEFVPEFAGETLPEKTFEDEYDAIFETLETEEDDDKEEIYGTGPDGEAGFRGEDEDDFAPFVGQAQAEEWLLDAGKDEAPETGEMVDGEDEAVLSEEIARLLPERLLLPEQRTPGGMDRELIDDETPPFPRGAHRFEHWFQPMKRDSARGRWVPDGAEKLLEPIDPGFFNAGGALKPSSLNDALKTLLTGKAEFSQHLSRESVRSGQARAGDRVHVALVDLTGKKRLEPEYAGWGSTVPVVGASCPKIAALYAAFQLRQDLKYVAAAENITRTANLVRFVTERWKKEGVLEPPNLDRFLYLHSNPPAIEFSAEIDAAINNIIDRDNSGHAARTLIKVVGFPYIASLLWQSGLRHPQYGGLWLTSSYDGGASWARPWRPKPGPVHGHNATALSLATFFTLLAQDRLVITGLPRTMKTALSTASWFSSTLPSASIASKVGLLLKCLKRGPKLRNGEPVLDRNNQPVTECKQSMATHVHEAGLIENGRLSYAVAILTVGIPAGASLLQSLIGELDTLIRKNNP